MLHLVNLWPAFAWGNALLQLLLVGLAAAVAAWVVWLLREMFGAKLSSDNYADAERQINLALAAGITFALGELEAWERAHSDVAVQSKIASLAAQFALNHIGDEANLLGLTPGDLAALASNMLPLPPQSGPIDSSAAVIPVERGELPPIVNI